MSIAFSKLHGRQEVIAMIRHSETDQRQQHNHSNPDINKELTPNNVDMKGLGYIGTIKAYDERLETIDQTNTNRRRDRVSCFELSIPYPDVEKNRWQDCERVMLGFLQDKYGDNLINAFVHYDEVHDYLDHGQIKNSRPHVHCFVVPEVEGKLNGKKFSARAEMSSTNKALDKKFQQELDIKFLTGDTPQRKTVEQLKVESLRELAAALQDKNNQLDKCIENLRKMDDFKEMVALYKQVYDDELEIILKNHQKSR